MTSAVTLAQSASATTTLNFKNRLINGDFEFWQRGTAQTFITAGVYLADRWTCMGFQQARHQRVAVSSPVTGMSSRFAMRVSSSINADNGSGGTRMDLSQKIENANCYDLAGQTVTYSYWIRFSSATATSIANLTNSAFLNFNSYLASSTTNTDAATSTDSIGSVNGQRVITNGSLPTTWTKITQTATIPVGANNVALRLQFQALGSTASAGDVWYEVTELQLEEGSFATGFDKRPAPIELLLCQRYYEKSYDLETNPGSATFGGSITTFPAAFAVYFPIQYKVMKRATPTVTFYSPLNGATGVYNFNATTNVALSGTLSQGQYGCCPYTGATPGNVSAYIHFTAQAEL